MERKIPVYGALLSTWPAASGVIVEDGTAYVAANRYQLEDLTPIILKTTDYGRTWTKIVDSAAVQWDGPGSAAPDTLRGG